ncbi:MAG: exo-alpha-sialidase [Candidatus Marinimicrobia bacterium]|nr:exo-alpha-sialidase [Candidatus Neomarinimicrobiota bacterium]
MKKLILSSLLLGLINGKPLFQQYSIFPFQDKHVHGSSVIELPNGDLLSCWFHGSGERKANDVRIKGSRLKKGSKQWGDIFDLADTPNLPDCNPVLWIDKNDKLWLFWIAVRANQWENSILRYKTSIDYLDNEIPTWNWQDNIILQPGERFLEAIQLAFKEHIDEPMWAEYALPYSRLIIDAAKDPEKRQKGWMTRIHPISLESGRILLPLYSDGYNISIVAISDDNGNNWKASNPIVGLGPIQPSLVQKQNGHIVAYMRDSGIAPKRILKSISKDNGETWSFATDTKIPNPSSSVEALQLENGNWVMACNDTESSRSQMAILLSFDEGKSWEVKKYIGKHDHNSGITLAYPSLIQSSDRLIHLTYSLKDKKGKTIQHAIFNEDWIKNK